MLTALKRRAERAGLLDRIDVRLSRGGRLGIEDLSAAVDFAAALHLVHEVPDQQGFFTEIWNALKPEGRLLVVEPKRHVSQEKFEGSLAVAKQVGFRNETGGGNPGPRSALLVKG
jgi:SAM-dependent methyltransferase